MKPAYPSTLAKAGIEGRVVVRFVVDTDGRVELPSVRVVESSQRYFLESVLKALPRMRFLPAVKGGRKVRQLVEEPFNFNMP